MSCSQFSFPSLPVSFSLLSPKRLLYLPCYPFSVLYRCRLTDVHPSGLPDLHPRGKPEHLPYRVDMFRTTQTFNGAPLSAEGTPKAFIRWHECQMLWTSVHPNGFPCAQNMWRFKVTWPSTLPAIWPPSPLITYFLLFHIGVPHEKPDPPHRSWHFSSPCLWVWLSLFLKFLSLLPFSHLLRPEPHSPRGASQILPRQSSPFSWIPTARPLCL